jgi:large conductance mechanosensitive channel
MGLVKEFKEFAVKGNVVDLAVGVIIGGAFGKIVGSVIDDLVMPMVGKAIGNVDFTNLFLPLYSAPEIPATLVEAKKLGPVFAYGNFLTILIQFLILAWIIFMMIKGINRLKREAPAAPAAPPEPTTSEKLLTEIRDSLKARG